jgi:hypothetical protein
VIAVSSRAAARVLRWTALLCAVSAVVAYLADAPPSVPAVLVGAAGGASAFGIVLGD